MNAERPLTCSPPSKQRRPESREAPQCLAPSTWGRGGVQAWGGCSVPPPARAPALFSPGPRAACPRPLLTLTDAPAPIQALWSRCVRAQVPGFGAICQHSPLFLSKALSATSLRSHLASKVHMPKWLKTTQSVPSRVAVIQQSRSPSSRFRQGAGKASALKPPCQGPRASPSSSGRAALHPPYLGKPGSC